MSAIIIGLLIFYLMGKLEKKVPFMVFLRERYCGALGLALICLWLYKVGNQTGRSGMLPMLGFAAYYLCHWPRKVLLSIPELFNPMPKTGWISVNILAFLLAYIWLFQIDDGYLGVAIGALAGTLAFDVANHFTAYARRNGATNLKVPINIVLLVLAGVGLYMQ